MFCTELGWGTEYNSDKAKDLVDTGKAAAERHSYILHDAKNQIVMKENMAYLDSIIRWSEQHDVKVLFFTPPAFKTYREHLNKEQLNLTIETINYLVLNHDNCCYLNMLADTNFVARDFYDADHLSEIGAKKLSLFINKTIENCE